MEGTTDGGDEEVSLELSPIETPISGEIEEDIREDREVAADENTVVISDEYPLDVQDESPAEIEEDPVEGEKEDTDIAEPPSDFEPPELTPPIEVVDEISEITDERAESGNEDASEKLPPESEDETALEPDPTDQLKPENSLRGPLINVAFSMVDPGEDDVISKGKFRLYKNANPFQEWDADAGELDVALHEGGNFTFHPPSWKDLPQGYTIPGSVNFKLNDDGTITDIHGNPIRDFMRNRLFDKAVFIRIMKSDAKVIIRCRDIDNQDVELQGVRLRLKNFAGGKPYFGPTITYVSSDKPQEFNLWPYNDKESEYDNSYQLSLSDGAGSIPDGYELVDRHLDPHSGDYKPIMFYRHGDDINYRVMVKYGPAPSYIDFPQKEITIWLRKKPHDVNVRVVDDGNNNVADAPIRVRGWDYTTMKWVEVSNYTDDYLSEAVEPWKLKLQPGDYHIEQGGAPLPFPYVWSQDQMFRVKDDGKLQYKDAEHNWFDIPGNTVKQTLLTGVKVKLQKTDENDVPFAPKGDPGYTPAKTAELILTYDSGSGSFGSFIGSYKTDQVNPWFKSLLAGDYFFYEKEPPTDYQDTEGIMFRVESDGALWKLRLADDRITRVKDHALTEVTLKNIPYDRLPVRFSVIEKGDADEKELSGIHLLLGRDKPTPPWVMPITTTGSILTEELFPGEYTFEYAHGGDYAEIPAVRFEIDTNGNLFHLFRDEKDVWQKRLMGDNLIRLELERGTLVRFNKIDINKPGEMLQGAFMKLSLGLDVKRFWETDSSVREFMLLDSGDSVYKYEETKSPMGYDGGAAIRFKLNNGKIVILDDADNETPLIGNMLTIQNIPDDIGDHMHDVFLNARDTSGVPASLAGASIEVERWNYSSSAYEAVPGAAFISTDSPRHIGLFMGRYRIRSLAPPPAYDDDAGYTEFQVNDDGSVDINAAKSAADPPDWVDVPDKTVHLLFKQQPPPPTTPTTTTPTTTSPVTTPTTTTPTTTTTTPVVTTPTTAPTSPSTTKPVETIPVGSKPGDDNVPKTGESWPIGYVAGGLLLVLAGLALMLLKKNMRAGE